MTDQVRRVLVTGAGGFIGKNLTIRLQELPHREVLTFLRTDDVATLRERVARADAIVHLAGENRPADAAEFTRVNVGLTSALCEALREEHARRGRHVPLVLASSAQAGQDNPYGQSKLAAEERVRALARETGNPCAIFRLPGVFGKWCRPNYNSVVATFCHHIARDLPIRIDDPEARLRLVHVDDVVTAFLATLDAPPSGCVQARVEPEYALTLGTLARHIRAFHEGRSNLTTGPVGTGLLRALYATYVSYLPAERFSYPLTRHADPRGVFVEMMKTSDSGQFSYFTAFPGVTRGGHYHHTKTEKFLVIQGEALFRFRHLLTDERFELRTRGSRPEVVDTIPGWSHDITNVGTEELVVMLWANEVFDRDRPDTIASKVQ